MDAQTAKLALKKLVLVPAIAALVIPIYSLARPVTDITSRPRVLFENAQGVAETALLQQRAARSCQPSASWCSGDGTSWTVTVPQSCNHHPAGLAGIAASRLALDATEYLRFFSDRGLIVPDQTPGCGGSQTSGGDNSQYSDSGYRPATQRRVTESVVFFRTSLTADGFTQEVQSLLITNVATASGCVVNNQCGTLANPNIYVSSDSAMNVEIVISLQTSAEASTVTSILVSLLSISVADATTTLGIPVSSIPLVEQGEQLSGSGRRLGHISQITSNAPLVTEVCGPASAVASPPPPPACSPEQWADMEAQLFNDAIDRAVTANLQAAASTSEGCRVDLLLGTELPTMMSVWASIMVLLLIHAAPNLVLLLKKGLDALGLGKVAAKSDTTKADSTSRGGGPLLSLVLGLHQVMVICLTLTILSFVAGVYSESAWVPTVTSSNTTISMQSSIAAAFASLNLPEGSVGISSAFTNLSADGIYYSDVGVICTGAYLFDEGTQSLLGIGTSYGGTSNRTGQEADLDGMLTFVGMCFCAPLSPRLSITWMLLIEATGRVIRAERETRERVASSPSFLRRLEYGWARLTMYVLIPIVTCMISIILATMLVGVVAALYQIDLVGIWAAMLCVVATRAPLFVLFSSLGIDNTSSPVPADAGQHGRMQRLLLRMSESRTFKYYFTASLQLVTVVLQLFVTTRTLSSLKTTVGDAAFEEYIREFGGQSGKIYNDFFGLSTVSSEFAFSGIDLSFWTHFTTGAEADRVFTIFSKITYTIGMGSYVLLACIKIAQQLFRRASVEPVRDNCEVAV